MPTTAACHGELLHYRSEFPLLDASVYLNTCSLGARSERSRARLEGFLAEWDSLGARAWYRRRLDDLDGLRRTSDRSSVAAARIALAASVSAALAVLASALDPIHRGDASTLEMLRAAGGRGRHRPAHAS